MLVFFIFFIFFFSFLFFFFFDVIFLYVHYIRETMVVSVAQLDTILYMQLYFIQLVAHIIWIFHNHTHTHTHTITKTRLYSFDPLKPHFYIVKLGFTGVYIIFLISAQNIDCGYSLEPPRRGGSNEYPQSIMFWAEIWKISEFLCENFLVFSGKIFSIFE